MYFSFVPHTVYILNSKKLNRFYTGETSDFDVRKMFHFNSLPHKFTAEANDWELFLRIECLDKNQGRLVEAHIKKMKSSLYIKNLKKYPEMVKKLVQKYNC